MALGVSKQGSAAAVISSWPQMCAHYFHVCVFFFSGTQRFFGPAPGPLVKLKVCACDEGATWFQYWTTFRVPARAMPPG